jgi:hypothetical protein
LRTTRSCSPPDTGSSWVAVAGERADLQAAVGDAREQLAPGALALQQRVEVDVGRGRPRARRELHRVQLERRGHFEHRVEREPAEAVGVQADLHAESIP